MFPAAALLYAQTKQLRFGNQPRNRQPADDFVGQSDVPIIHDITETTEDKHKKKKTGKCCGDFTKVQMKSKTGETSDDVVDE